MTCSLLKLLLKGVLVLRVG